MICVNNTTLSLLVNGRHIDEYLHDGKCYVEGRKGSEYSLYYRNMTARRQKVVASVDGLNVMSGDTTWNRGYVVDPWGTITIPGWRKDSGNVAAFEFSSRRGSYNQHNDAGDSRNIGVIGCRVFNEVVKPPPRPLYSYHYHYSNPAPFHPNCYWNNYTPDLNISWGSTSAPDNLGGGGGGTSSAHNLGGGGGNAPEPHIGAACMRSVDNMNVNWVETQLGFPNIGTGWGDNMSFDTVDVYYVFEPNVFAELVLYYDDRRGLLNRGIRLREDRVSPQAFPNAFPSDGCPAPK